MSYKPGFYGNFGNNYTFQNNVHNIPSYFPMLPPPPPPVTPFVLTPKLSDQDFIKKYENRLHPELPKVKESSPKISELKENLTRLLVSLNYIQEQERKLSSNLDTLSEEEWREAFENIKINKNIINNSLSKLSSSYLDLCKRLVTKRTAKRLRLKKLREVKKSLKQEKIKLLVEKSRKIDENLQKIKDDIQKARKEEEDKIQSDIILKEVIRKKQDAKKSIAKLDALLKLRNARQNTARGKGQILSDAEAKSFQENIEKIKQLWVHKLSSYDKEEAELRGKLEISNKQQDLSNVKEVTDNLIQWREALFGGNVNPQMDFKGDIARFISVRSQWDCFIDNGEESTPIPMGWVLPKKNNCFNA